jgi:hypothetical protein
VRRSILHADDLPDDVSASRNENVRTVSGVGQSRSAMACDRYVWTELLHGPTDHPLRGTARRHRGVAVDRRGAAGAGLAGTEVTHFWLSLILLGFGWNFSSLGASALVLECHKPEERTRVQALNDFLVFGMMVIATFASGGLDGIWLVNGLLDRISTAAPRLIGCACASFSSDCDSRLNKASS